MRLTVYERNRPDDTFGFGVVFSDETLETFEKYDLESYRAITANFAYWDDIEIHFKGTTHRVGGNGFCGCARVTLLRLLQERARALGVEMKFQTEIDPAAHRDADLIVAADGINSRIRAQHADVFRPETDLRPNKFAWMGSTRPFDAFTFFFKETEHGIFIAHCYQYEAGQSTWVMETDPETFARAGLDKLDEQQSAKFLEGVFAKELEGHKLTVNRSLWRNFPTIRCEKWTHDNIVLIGDAKATAHFSIGSGTKLAMEDAIALFNAFQATGAKDVKQGARALRDRAAAGGREDAAFRRRVAGVVRARAPLLGHGPDALRVRPDDAREGDHLRQSRAARAGVRRRDRQGGGARRASAGLRRRRDEAHRADVPALPAARHDAEQSRRRLADGPVFGAGRHADRLASRASGQPRDRRRGAGVHRDGVRLGRCAHHAWLHRHLQRRAGSRVEAHRGLHPRQFGRQVLPPARARRPQGRDQADVGGHGPAARRGRVADHLGVADPVLSGEPDPARNDARRHGQR